MKNTIAPPIVPLLFIGVMGLFSTPIVSGNTPGIPENVRGEEIQYQNAVERANTEYILRINAAREQFVSRLKLQIINLTRKGDLDEALRLRERIKDVEMSATTQPLSTHLQPKPTIRPKLGHQSMTGIVVACGNNSYVMCINGERILQGEKEPKQAQVKIAIGDVITVRAFNNWDPHGFMCIFIFKDRKQEIISSTKWKCYTPKTALKWYSPAEIPSDLEDAQLGRTNIVDGMEQVVVGDERSIWGAKPGGECFLTLTVTEDALQELNISPPVKPNGR